MFIFSTIYVNAQIIQSKLLFSATDIVKNDDKSKYVYLVAME